MSPTPPLSTRRTAGLLAALLLAAPGCKREQPEAPGATAPAKAPSGGKIALLLPESKTARYESHDRPHFERRVKELCADCEVLYSNADQSVAKQQDQAEAALVNGAKVLVLDPVDSGAAAAIVARARQSKVAVLSYERLVLNADVDYYISFDNEQVGRLQGQALVDKLKADGKTQGTLVMLHGAPTDDSSRFYKSGAHGIIDGSGLTVGAEYDTPDWSPDKAQQQMEQAITRLGKDKIIGVYSANDGMAGGAIAAMKAAGMDPLPPVTGQDAELTAVQRILTGEQYMTVYLAIKLEAGIAAEVAVALLRGEKPPAERINGKVNNGTKDVPSILLTPVAVTKENVKSTVLADKFWTAAQLCEGSYASACASAQLTP
ncbi:L-arabinose-binding periplasmic protein precursor AraF [Cystobacter fuscus DSM 2262]|uniref:L-arabinose-binding periplasmic protein AraF n=1 Tax=Cystobacter fuscus (strain ATCC 25194 / DSM 2262 / NBRC 100088 / M29) TaxID=1242864 RepID=S9QRQ7_CYSF2|nr:sugar ABC transporter substrate-binding protein [Cystobacter fuscus]EPX59303.1 L-arabinose-binding periplasmic protein precursor AraF [Cystobacter fuscus DSM 2262]